MNVQEILARRLKTAKEKDSQAAPHQTIKVDQNSNRPVLSFAQERFWFLNQLQPENVQHHRAFAWTLTGSLHPEIFSDAVSAIVQRHEVLRTAIFTENNQPQAQVHPAHRVNIPLIDLSQTPDIVQSEAEKVWSQPIPLDEAPLLRGTIFKLSDRVHVALFVMHHVTFDALSEEVFKREFAQLYEQLCAGQSPSLLPLPIQMSDFSKWQREDLTGEKLAQLEQYWLDKLREAPHILTLPTDRPRPVKSSFSGGTESVTLPAEQIEPFSSHNNVTSFMTLLSAFYVLLKRYTDQEDILVATPVSGRTHPDTADLIGFFANTLVLRGDLSGEPTFVELLSQIRSTSLQALEHQAYPIDKLFEALKVQREENIPPLFQVLFNFEQVTSGKAIPNGPTIEPLELAFNAAQLDLAVEVQHDGRNLVCHFRYNRDLFDPATIGRMAQHFKILLAGCISQPNTPISQLPILTAQEKQQILYAWNQTDVNFGPDYCIHEEFEQMVLEQPDQIAVSGHFGSLTYRELNEQSNQLAHHLMKMGVGPESLVGFYLERSLGMMVGLLGILKAGGAYVPIDPHLPADRVKFMLEDSNIQIVVTQSKWAKKLPITTSEVICVDALPETVLQESKVNCRSGVQAHNLVYMIYTSGSTGLPKGVMISHQNLRNFVYCRNEEKIYTKESWVLQTASLSFDAAAVGLICPLLVGGRVVLSSEEGFKDINGTLEIIKHEKVTAISCSPTVMNHLLASPKLAECTDLTQGFSGGEALPVDLKDRWLKQTNLSLFNGYGPTETSIGVTVHQCELNSPYTSVPIGKPSANCKIYILDHHLNPLPIGVPGEIYIGGVCVGRGYWNRPELTDEKFIPNRYGDGKIYRTGDLARYLPDGNIEFLGRIDHQVKIRGFRIELGEIESTILEHPDIRQAVVLAPKLNGSSQLVAYVVPNSADRSISPKEISEFIGRKLPNYMLPSYIITLAEFPLLVSSKINLNALPQPGLTHLISENNFVAPQTEIEQTLAKIWAQVLKVDRVGTEDNFFELGGHSLLVTQIITRIAAELNVELPIKTFFDHPKLCDQATLIEFMLDI